MKLRIKLKKLDEELLIKQFKVDLGTQKSMLTPTKSSNPKTNIGIINEIYRKYSLEKLKKISNNENLERKENISLIKDQSNNIDFFIIDYTDINIPKEKELETLADIQYSHSEVVITPTCSQICRKLNAENLTNQFSLITKNFIEIINTLNNKTIIGVIPARLPRQFVEELLELYIKNDITSFVIDYDGRSIDPNPSWQRNLIRLLTKANILEEGILYSINNSKGKFMKDAKEILAKDFVSLGFGIDVLGFNHISPRMPSEVWKSLGRKGKERSDRLFLKENYSYLKISEESFKNEFDINYKINFKEELVKTNTKNQLLETDFLKRELFEEGTLVNYLKNKEQIDDKLINKFKMVKREVKSKKLVKSSISNWF